MLQESFMKYGERFTFTSSVGKYAVYRRADTYGIRSDGSLIPPRSNYEIIIPVWDKIVNEYRYPGSSFWGIYGWSVRGEKQLVDFMMKEIPDIENIPICYSIKEYLEQNFPHEQQEHNSDDQGWPEDGDET